MEKVETISLPPEKVYAAPKLVRHGDIDELTQGSRFTDELGDVASMAG